MQNHHDWASLLLVHNSHALDGVHVDDYQLVELWMLHELLLLQ